MVINSETLSNEGIFLHELHFKAPLLYSSTAFSNFIELSNYVNDSNNQKISLNLFNNNQNELKYPQIMSILVFTKII